LTTVHTHSSLSLGNAFKFSFWRAFFCVLGALPSFGYLPFFRVFGLLYNTQKEFLTNTKWLLICMRIGGGGRGRLAECTIYSLGSWLGISALFGFIAPFCRKFNCNLVANVAVLLCCCCCWGKYTPHNRKTQIVHSPTLSPSSMHWEKSKFSIEIKTFFVFQLQNFVVLFR